MPPLTTASISLELLQGVTELIGAGDAVLTAPTESSGQSPELDPSSDREDRPGCEHPDGVGVHQSGQSERLRAPLGLLMLPECPLVAFDLHSAVLTGRDGRLANPVAGALSHQFTA